MFPSILEELLNEFRRPTTSRPHPSATVPSYLPDVELPPPSETSSSAGQAISKLSGVQLPLQTANYPKLTTLQPTILTEPSIMSLLRTAQLETVNSLNIFIPSDPDQLPRRNLMVFPSLTPAPSSQRFRSGLPEILEEQSKYPLTNTAGSDSPLIYLHSVDDDPSNGNTGSPFASVLRGLDPSQNLQNNNLNNFPSVSLVRNVTLSVRNNGEGESFQMKENRNSMLKPSLTNALNLNHLEHPTIVSQMLSLPLPDRLPLPRTTTRPAVQFRGPPSDIDKENEILDLTRENQMKKFKENPDITSSFSTILNGVGFQLDVSNPDVDINNPNPTTFAQPERGQKCVSAARNNVPAGGQFKYFFQ